MSARVVQSCLQGRRNYSISAIPTAGKFIRKMRGGAQSVLVESDDMQYFIVKMHGCPQGPNILANEFIGSIIAEEAELPVASGGCIYLSDDFIDQNLDLWFETPLGIQRPEAGFHFASKFLGEVAGFRRPTDYISRTRIHAVQNRSAFLGMYILDVWANHQDHRQAILIAGGDDRSLDASFIDHGHMFGGPHWNFLDRPGVACHLEASLYSGLLRPAFIAGWISHFENVLPNSLSRAISMLPSKWYKGDVASLHQTLLNRLARLPQLIEADIAGTQQFLKLSAADDLRLSHIGIQHLGASM